MFRFRAIENPTGLILVQPTQIDDERGWFMETFRGSQFEANGIPTCFLQDNHSYSRERGTIRGMHYQREPKAQGKLVRCIRGRIFDVAVDLRKGSPTYAGWAGFELTARSGKQLWIPEGFAHGFCTLTDDVEVAYKVTCEFDPHYDEGFAWDDPHVGIEWPVNRPVLSERDSHAPSLKESDPDFEWEG